MDTTAICKVAVATVGVVQLLKNLIGKGGKVVWTIVTVLCGIGITAVQYLCPPVIMDGIIAVAGATVFYDTIYKTFEKIFKRLGSSETEVKMIKGEDNGK